MILVTINMKVSAEKRREVSQAVTSLLGTISKEKGCARCGFFQDLKDENMVCLVEEWNSPTNFEAHCKSECFKVLRGAMNLLVEPCVINSYRSISR